MRTRVVLWHRVIPVYLTISLAFLVAGSLAAVPGHGGLLITGVVLLGAFITLMIVRYLLRGILGIQ